MKVLKFGSATIDTVAAIKHVAKIVCEESGNIIVLSSIHQTAEALEEISDYFYNKNTEGAAEVINRLELSYMNLVSSLFEKEESRLKGIHIATCIFDYIRSFSEELFTLFERRMVMAQGELLSSELFCLFLREKGHTPILLPALDFMRIDKNSVPDGIYIKEGLTALLDKNKNAEIYVTQGYICRNSYGEIADLQRGGSDFTASLIGAAVKAKEIQIWSNVVAMQNNDPQLIKDTKTIKQLSFDEAAELTYFGAKILHPTCIAPAKLANIPVRLKCTELPDAAGTLISNQLEAHTIKAIGAIDNITAINVKSGRMLLAHGFLRRIFEVFEHHQTSIDMLATSEIGVSLTIDNDHKLSLIHDDLKKYGTVSIDKDMVILSVVGDLDLSNSAFATEILSAIKEIPVRMISYGGSKYNFSLLIYKKDKAKALQLLNKQLFN